MKMIHVRAKQSERRDQRIRSALSKYPSLDSLFGPNTITINGEVFQAPMYMFVEWIDGDGETEFNIEVRDETIVERLASELKACGYVVSVEGKR